MQQDNFSKEQFMYQSLASQIAQMSLQVAEKDAIITEQQIELEQLRKEQIDEMDGAE